MNIKFFLLLIFIGFGLSLFAQPEGAAVETINGKKYYVHIVEQGNTLYGIQTLFKTDMPTLLGANPNLSDNLSIGQKVLIPVALSNSSYYKTHKVLSGETLYGISKKYSCTVTDIKNINPGIEEGISIGQEIKVPAAENQITETIQNDPEVKIIKTDYDISYKDSIVRHTVLEHETLYAIAKRYMVSTDTLQRLNNLDGTKVKKGDVLIVPIKKVNYQVLEKEIVPITNNEITQIDETIYRKDVYSIALMLPLMLTQNAAEMAKPLKLDQIREMYPLTKMCFEFYQGFVFAADSLRLAGFSVNIYVYDTKKDSATIANCFAKEEFKSIDMVVGPMYQAEINVTAKLCADKNIPLVLPFKVDAAIVRNNSNIYKAVASNMTLMDGTVDYIIKNHAQHNVLIVKPNSTSDLALFERTRARYNAEIVNAISPMNSKIIEVTSGSNSGRDLDIYLRKDTTNIVIVPSENVKFIAGILTRLNSVLNSNSRASKMRIIVFGLEDWNRYEDLDVLAKNRLNQHYASYRFVDYNEGRGLNFVRAYRARFGTDPSVFSMQGFDIGLYFMGALHLYGKNFDPHLKDMQIDLVQNDFKFQPIAENGGKENVRVCIAMYDNFKLIQMSK